MSRSWSDVLSVGPHLQFGSELVLWDYETPSAWFRASLMWQNTANAVRLGYSVRICFTPLLAAGTVWLIYSKRGQACAASINTWITRFFSSSLSLHKRPLNPKLYAQSRQYNRDVKYRYQPLDSLKDEVRLIYILPRAGEDEICTNLVHVSLYDQPEYLALSYTWGNPHPSSPLVLNGFDFEVRSNSLERSLTEEVTRNRKFCITELGRMGLVPASTEVGDRVVVLFGMQTPAILRKLAPVSVDARPACYQLLGESFVQGLMDGEAIRAMEMGNFHAEDLVIV